MVSKYDAYIDIVFKDAESFLKGVQYYLIKDKHLHVAIDLRLKLYVAWYWKHDLRINGRADKVSRSTFISKKRFKIERDVINKVLF